MWKFILIALWLVALAWMDIRRKHVPVWLLALGGIFVTIVSFYGLWQGQLEGREQVWSIVPGAVLLAVAVLTKKAGWADGMVLLFLGILTDFRECILSFTLSMLFISMMSLVLLALKRVRKNTTLPYLPFLCAGYLVQAALGLAA